MHRSFLFASSLLVVAAGVAHAQDDAGLPPLSAKGAIDAGDFGVLTLDIDWKGRSPTVATESFVLRRSDDGRGHATLEQLVFHNGRWTTALHSGNALPGISLTDQFDTKTAFGSSVLSTLNAAVGDGTLARSATIGSDGQSPVPFTLTWDPKGHTKGSKVSIKGSLRCDASQNLSFAPVDALGTSAEPLVDTLLAQLMAADRSSDELGRAVILFGRVDSSSGKLTLADTTWSCQADGVQAATASKSYTVSQDTDPSLQKLLGQVPGKNVIVRAVLTEGDPSSAKVLGLIGDIGWHQPVLNAPGGVVVADGSTLANLTDDEAAQVIDRRAEITSVDAKTGFATLRVPNRKGVTEPGTGYVPLDKVTLLMSSGASVYSDVPLPTGGDMAGLIERSVAH